MIEFTKYDLVDITEILGRAKIIWPGLDKEALRARLIACHNNWVEIDFHKMTGLPVDQFIEDITAIHRAISKSGAIDGAIILNSAREEESNGNV